MILKRIYDEKLAQASYLIGCAVAGEAIVVDPNRDAEAYVRAAAAEGLAITRVTETHIHADFVSGTRELAERTGARMYLSDEGGPDWKYGFAASSDATLLHDGDSIQVGNVRVDVLHTPGHTPEHLTFLVTDGAAADRAIGALTGDFVFVGDVGRPDLLEKAAGVSGTMEQGARELFRSLQRFKAQPDYLQIWPGHGAGSACGKGLSPIPHSTVGYERLFNWAFQIEDEDEFVDAVLAGQPEPPRYFAHMKRINRDGPPLLRGFKRPDRLEPPKLERLLAEGATLVDTRAASEFAAGHVPGTISIPLNRSFPTWAGWLLRYDTPFYLIVDDAAAGTLDEAIRALASIGLDRIGGYFGTDAIAAWQSSGRTLDTLPHIDVDEFARRLQDRSVHAVDVRGAAEWQEAHVPGIDNIPVGYLTDRLAELPDDQPIVLYCRSGSRSAIAASVLRAAGKPHVINLEGGILAWKRAGQPVESEPAAVPR